MKKKTNKLKKKVDAIQVMREIRDKISHEIKNMTFEEEKAYLKQLIAEGNLSIK